MVCRLDEWSELPVELADMLVGLLELSAEFV